VGSKGLIWALYQADNAKDYGTKNVPINLTSNQSVREEGTKEEKTWKGVLELRMEHTMRQVDSWFRVGAGGQR